MYELIKILFEICLLKKGPQDLPASPLLLKLLLVAYVVINLIILNMGVDFSSSLLQLGVEFIYLITFSYSLLYFFRRTPRYLQTFSALLGTDALLSLLSIPALASFTLNPSAITFLAIFLLIIWHWLVYGHIFRHALEQSFPFSLGLVLLYLILIYWIMSALFPELGSSTGE